MNFIKRLKALAAKEAAARIDAEGSRKPLERAVAEGRYRRATLDRTPLLGREKR